MAHTLTFIVDGLTTGIASSMRAQPIDTTGASVGSAISTGFVELGTSGLYLFHSTAIPDGHGAVKFYNVSDASAVLGAAACNPQESENADAKSSTLATATALSTVSGKIDTVDDLLDTEMPALTTAVATLTTNVATVDTVADNIYARLGEPAGDDIAADIAAVSTGGVTAGAIADAVLDELLSGHTTSGTLGKAIADLATSLAAIPTTAAPTTAQIKTAIEATGSMLDTLVTRLTAQRATNLDELGAANIPADLDTLIARLTSTRAAYLDNLQYLTVAPPTASAIATATNATLTTAHGSGAWTGSGGGGSSAGDGDTAVDHDYGSTDALTVRDVGGNGIDGATIRAYVASEYTASRTTATVRATVRTASDGTWIEPMMLDAGDYTLVVTTANGQTIPGVIDLTVA